LLEDRRSRTEQVKLVKAQCFDPLEHILLGRRLQRHILRHKRILAENDSKDMLAGFEFLNSTE
jgi:hypothetical protein